MLKFVISCIAFIASAGAGAAALPTHCNSEEEAYFNCQIKGSKKIASVCGAGFNSTTRDPGYLQYRFGLPERIEFKYPATTAKEDMKDRFTYSASRTADYVQYDFVLQFQH